MWPRACLEAIKGRRDKLVIASKVRFKVGDAPDQQGLTRKAILRAIDESLRRLQTDYLDIYYLHAPDHATPIEESLETMDSLVKQGKVRYVASSNYAGWEVVEMLWLAKEHSWAAPYISQPMYNLLARGIEQEYLAMCKEFGVSTIVYNPLAGGLLTGKHQQETITPGTRFDNNKLYQDRYWHDRYFKAVEELREIARHAGRSLVSLALNWLLHHTASDVVILGASSLAQLNENLAACEEGPLDDNAQRVRSDMAGFARAAAGLQPLSLNEADRLPLGPASVVTIRLGQECAMASGRGLDKPDIRVPEQLLTRLRKNADERVILGVQHESRNRNAIKNIRRSSARVVILGAGEPAIARGDLLVEVANAAQPAQILHVVPVRVQCCLAPHASSQPA